MSRTTPSKWMRRALCSLCLGALCVWSGCEGSELKEKERQEINRVLSTGVHFEGDPYVRAETLRVLEVLADPRLDPFAREVVEEDASMMVRVAALRALMATENAEVERIALATYSRADDEARLALLRAAIEYGPASLRGELFERALRSEDIRLRELAFTHGTLDEVNRAVAEDDTTRLKTELIPRLSQLVDSEDFFIAAVSLRKLRELGRQDRAEPLLEKFEDEQTPVKKRVRLARILRLAGIEAAREPFAALVVDVKEELAAQGDKKEDTPRDEFELELPETAPDERLVRAAVLGAVALGDGTFVRAAQAYLRNADAPSSREVLEALARNSDPEATLSLKIAMKDARPSVRLLAIDLYGARADAEARGLINAMRMEDPMTRRKLANILVARFPEEWSQDLRLQLRAPERRDLVLALLRDVVDRERDRKILSLISEQLVKIARKSDGDANNEQAAATAAYLLLLSDPDNEDYRALLRERSGVRTRYVFLEHLVRTDAHDSVEIFRRSFYDDLYAMRLMSAAGLWNAFRDTATPAPTEPREGGGEPAEGAAEPS